MTFDHSCDWITRDNPNMLVPWWLMACYAYYVEDEPILSDAAFDKLCSRLKALWDTVDHFHKGLIDGDALQTGGYLKKEDYPARIVGAVAALKLDKREQSR